ncbi:MAG: hypothetical protein AAFQ02_00875 [Bacteroidota bacterium]
MKLPWWKHALSYLWDIQIDYASSEHNPDLIILLTRGKIQLCTAKAVYSYEDRYENFRIIIDRYIDYDKLSGRDVLILGLGLGSIPQMLDQKSSINWVFTAVEIDETVIELAHQYGFDKINSDITTVTADAETFVSIDEGLYDLIFVDLFIGETTPMKFRTADFLMSLRDLCGDDGYIIYNTPAFTQDDRQLSRVFFEEVFSVVLKRATLIKAHRNFMLIWKAGA